MPGVSGAFRIVYGIFSAVQYVGTEWEKIEGVSVEMTLLQRTLSGLIEAVYLADSNELVKAGKIVMELGYEEVDPYPAFVVIAADSERAEEIRLKVFRRGTECVVAIRGTSLRSVADISDNYRILKQDLHNSPGYPHIKEIITLAIEKYKGKVCVAGHSLGAAFALIITRELALSEQVVETHLFNPPFVTFNVISTALEAANKIKEDFSKLQASPWNPNLYLNPHDSICNEYIAYFEKPDNFLDGMGPNSYHLIPKATVFINQHRMLIDMLASHENNQWSENRMENLIKAEYSIACDLWYKREIYQPDETAGPSVVGGGLRDRQPFSGSAHKASPLTSNGSCPDRDSGVESRYEHHFEYRGRYGGDPNSPSATHTALPRGPPDSRPALPCPSIQPNTCESSLTTSPNAPPRASSEPLRLLKTMTKLESMTMLETPDESTTRPGSSPVKGSEDVGNSPSAVSAAHEQVDASGKILNILLLGETGVGKSTFINALYNYLKFDSLDEALGEELQTLIYSDFPFAADKYSTELTNIRCGKPDDNEGGGNPTPGSSSTQSCRAYTFNIGEGETIRLIDTPGIGDTRGITQDVENMKGIISSVARHKELHAICILLKPDQSRLTPALKYSIIELLRHLHRDASNNILFCFTNSRSSMFRAGSTLQILRELLSNPPGLAAIQLNGRTMYHFDNEAFRFLACMKNGVQFQESETTSFNSSWKHSVEEASRLLKHISSLHPHDIQITLTLNLVREMLAGIEEPVANLALAMEHNLEDARRNARVLRRLFKHGTSADLRGALKIKVEVLETVELGHRRTICKSTSCKDAICHEPCELSETALGRIQGVFLGEREVQLFCNKFSLASSECSVCKCSRSSHRRVSKGSKIVEHEREDENIRKIIDEVEDDIEKEGRVMQLLEEREKSIQEEWEAVINAAAIFAGFLEQNSIVVYHSATREYFKSQIEKLKKASADEDTDEGKTRVNKQIEELVSHLGAYERKVQNFKARCRAQDEVTMEQVKNELNKLYDLRENGRELRSLMQDIEREYIHHSGASWGRDEVVCNMTVPVAQAGASTSPGRSGGMSRLLRTIRDHLKSSGHKGDDKRAQKP